MPALLVPPLLTARKTITIGPLLFGVFYQQLPDPTSWVQVAILWALPSRQEANPSPDGSEIPAWPSLAVADVR